MSLRTILTVVLVTAACSGDKLDGAIDYSMSGGFAGGIATTLRIEPSGRYRLTNLDQAPREGTLDAGAFAALRARIQAANFPTLDETYECCPDDYVETISVELDGEVHTVQADRSADKPERLEAVLETIQELAGTSPPRL